MKVLVTTFLLALVFSVDAIGQNDRPFQNLQIQSPNAAALEKFGKIPVNYHTGIPQISIPIYTVSSGSLSMPISVNYHSGGLKVMETASWVGAGWSLMAGGAITREVRGAPDEDQDFTGTNPQTYGHYSHKGYNSYVRNLNGSEPNPNNYALFYDVATGTADGEPDMYYFNFNGNSGQFYFDDDNTPVFQPAADYKVDVLRNATNGFYKWIITTPDGTRYHFGQGENESGAVEPIIRAEKTYPFREFSGATFHAAVSSWLLTKIESADGKDIIRLHYVSERYGFHALYPALNGYNFNISRVKNSVEGWRLAKITFSNGSVDFVPGALRQDLCAYNLWSGSDAANAEAKSLSEIQIKHGSTECFKRFTFTHSYFNNTGNPTYFAGSYTVNTDRKRLKLDQIQEVSCASEPPKPPYLFTYYEPSSVPRRLSYAQDHWGYYNGKTGNTSLTPNGASRESAYPAMRAGTLSKIQYPTGGSSSFSYESNDVFRQYQLEEPSTTIYTSHNTAGTVPITKNVTFESGKYYVELSCTSAGAGTATLSLSGTGGFVYELRNGETENFIVTLSGTRTLSAHASDNMTTGTMKFRKVVLNTYARDFEVGGLRVLQIVNSTSSTPGNPDDVVTTYNYDNNSMSSGVLYGRPAYVSLIRNDFNYEYGYRDATGALSPGNPPLGCQFPNPQPNKLASVQSIFPMDHSQGYHIGYEYVVVTQSDGGQSQYQYNIATDKEALKYQPIAIVDLAGLNCDLSVPNYPPAPLSFVPGRGDLIAEYHFSGVNPVKETHYSNIYTTLSGKTPALIHQLGPQPFTTFYELRTAKLTSSTVTSIVYDRNNASNSVTTVQLYSYSSNKHNQVMVESITGNTGTYKKENKYPLDYTNGCEIGTASLTTYNSAVSTCATSHPYNSHPFSSANWYNTRRNYEHCASTARGNYATNRITDKTNAETCLNTKYTSASTNLKPVLALLSMNKHLPIEISSWKDNLFLGAGFNQYKDYGTSRTSGLVYPENVYVFQTAAPLASSNFTPSSISGNNVVRDADYSPSVEVNYKFSNGRLIEITDKSGVSTSYLWSYGNALPVAKAENTQNTKIAYTSFENGNSDGGWTFSATTNTGNYHTGTKSHRANANITKSGLPSGDYVISFWAKRFSTTSPGVTVNGSTISANTTSWTYYEATVNGTSITVTPNNVYLDELRLRPVNAQMTTYTYNPLVGMTSISDPAGIVTTYEYDTQGRLKNVKDEKSNVLEHVEYHYSGQP